MKCIGSEMNIYLLQHPIKSAIAFFFNFKCFIDPFGYFWCKLKCGPLKFKGGIFYRLPDRSCQSSKII